MARGFNVPQSQSENDACEIGERRRKAELIKTDSLDKGQYSLQGEHLSSTIRMFGLIFVTRSTEVLLPTFILFFSTSGIFAHALH